MKTFRLEVPVFKSEVLIISDCTAAGLGSYLWRRFKLRLDDDLENCSATVLTFASQGFRVVWFRHLELTSEGIGEIAHEMFHLVIRICRDKGIPVLANIETGECGDEAAAYLMDWLMKEVLDLVATKKVAK